MNSNIFHWLQYIKSNHFFEFTDITIHEQVHVIDIFSYKVNAMTMNGLHVSEILIESQTSLSVCSCDMTDYL